MDKSKLKIMLVTEQPEVRAIVRNCLRDEGYTKVSLSENGLSALRKVQAEPVDLIIADFNLEGLSGLELLREVRQDSTLKETPFILLSSELEQQHVARAAEYRVNAYIVKPFSQQTLAAKVNGLFRRRVSPTQGEFYFREANRLAEAGDLDGALERYQAALEATKESMAAVHYKMGRVQEDLEEDDQAEVSYQEAVELSKLYVDAYDALGAMSLRRERLAEALEYFRRSSDISPLNTQRQIRLGEALLEAGDFEASEKAFKLALNLDPSQTHLFNRLGISLRRQGKLDEARAYFHRAIEAAADDEHLYFNLSRVYYDQGDKTAAVSYLKKALGMNPDFKEARELIAEIEGG